MAILVLLNFLTLDSHLQFIFTNIDESNPDGMYMFSLKIEGDSEIYKGECRKVLKIFLTH